jgi:hypothetical protein
VPLAFAEPDFARIPDALQIISRDNNNTFGYWQSPEDAVEVEANYLYRARFVVLSDQTNQPLVPQIRLRANSRNLQQSDYIGIESNGDGGASPTPAGNTYDLYFIPPGNDDFCMLAFDLLNFDVEDAKQAALSLDSVVVERFSLDSLSTPTLVRSYDFTTGEDGWTTGGAPIVFSSPAFSREAGALVLRSESNTNTFGFWKSNAADITIAADVLYRGTFEVRTDVTDRTVVPQMRLRFNTENLQASRTLSIESIGDAGNSPGVMTTRYDKLYFAPPDNCAGAGLMISFDMLNFSPGDSMSASLFLDSATVEGIAPPGAP